MLSKTEKPNIPQQYVEGIGMLGPDKGYVEGELAARKQDTTEKAVDIQQGYLDITKEKHSWDKEDRDRQQFIMSGMAAASQDGGYEAVIDFLKNVDPNMAIDFTKKKLGLDQSIMQNDVMKAKSQYEIADAMVGSYALLGKMGGALLQAPQEQRDGLYKQMLPMIEKVNPNAPKSLNEDAVNMFMLSAAQAMPQNGLYSANKQAVTSYSTLGKIDADIKSRLEQGISPNDPGLQALLAQRGQYVLQNDNAQFQLLQKQQQLDISKNKNDIQIQQMHDNLNKQLVQMNPDWNKSMATYTSIMGNLDTLSKDPNNANAMAIIGRAMAKEANGGGVMTDVDVADVIQGNDKYTTAWEQFKGITRGERVIVTPDSLANLKDIFHNTMERKISRQSSLERQFKESLKSNPLIDYNRLRFPSQTYYDMNKPAQQPQITQQQIEATAKKYGITPEEVMAKIKQKLGGGQ